jgi:hypothetical protein
MASRAKISAHRDRQRHGWLHGERTLLSSWRYDGLRSFRLPFSALTVSARVAGAREALFSSGSGPTRNFYRIGDPRGAAFVQGLTAGRKICANDFTIS